MSTAIDLDEKQRRALIKAANGAGIDPETLPIFRREQDSLEAVPVLEAPRLSDAEWELLAPLLPRKSRYLSNIDPRDFIDAALYLAMCGFKFRLVPADGFNTEAFRAKYYRSCLAGVFAELAACAQTQDAFHPQHAALFCDLRAAEERYVKRHREIVEDGRKQLARARVGLREPG